MKFCPSDVAERGREMAVDGTEGHLVLISLGGTITMTAAAGAGVRPTLDGGALLASLPAARARAVVKPFTLRTLPSPHLTFEDMAEVAGEIERHIKEGAIGIVVSQGTDTLEETAFAFDLLLDTDVPVVLTGAMRNPAQPGADGPANLAAALQVAAHPAARGQGVTVVLDDTVHAARYVRKAHTTAYSTFTSEPAGPLAWITEGVPTFVARIPRCPSLPRAWAEPSAKVAVVTAGLDVGGELIEAAVERGFSGIVVQAMGAGHTTPAMADALEEAAERVPVVLTSRTGAGQVLSHTYGFLGGEVDLLRRGLIGAGWLNAPKARVALTLLLRAGEDRRSIGDWFDTYCR